LAPALRCMVISGRLETPAVGLEIGNIQRI
jgi:hypothetical protein